MELMKVAMHIETTTHKYEDKKKTKVELVQQLVVVVECKKHE